MGLVNRVVGAAALDDCVADYTDRIGDNAPLTVAACKQIVDAVTHAPEGYDADRCERLVAECFASDDYAEGRQAFMAKRRPVFHGR